MAARQIAVLEPGFEAEEVTLANDGAGAMIRGRCDQRVAIAALFPFGDRLVSRVLRSENIVAIDAVGQPCPNPLTVILDEREVAFDESISQLLIRHIRLVATPNFFDLSVLLLLRRNLRGCRDCHAILHDLRDGQSMTRAQSIDLVPIVEERSTLIEQRERL